MANCTSLYEEIMYNLVNRYLSVRHLGCWQFSLQWTLYWGTFAHIVLNYFLAGKWWYWRLAFYYQVSHWKDCTNYFSISRMWVCHSPTPSPALGEFFFFYFRVLHMANGTLFQFTYLWYWVSQVVLVVKNTPASSGNTRDPSSIPESGRSPGGGRDNPLQYSSLGQRSLAGYSS